MALSKNYKLAILLMAFCFCISSCADGQSKKTESIKDTQPPSQTIPANITELLKKQMLLTNVAQFSEDRTLEGASGFLIKYNDSIFAITARHLLGEAGGIESEISINDLDKSLIKWKMLPRILNNNGKETVELTAKGIDFSQSGSDIVLLKVLTKDFEIQTLTPNFELPAVGETLFLIGCPYSERNCKQNVYPVRYAQFDEPENSIVFETNLQVNLSGFSGAPVINGKGEVLGILTSSFKERGKDYSMATHIKEIQKIKF